MWDDAECPDGPTCVENCEVGKYVLGKDQYKSFITIKAKQIGGELLAYWIEGIMRY